MDLDASRAQPVRPRRQARRPRARFGTRRRGCATSSRVGRRVSPRPTRPRPAAIAAAVRGLRDAAGRRSGRPARGAPASRRHPGGREPCRPHRTGDERPAVRRAPGGVLVEPPVRVGGRQAPGGAARRRLRARGHPAARPRPVRRHGARLGEASGDAGLPRRLPVDWPVIARCPGDGTGEWSRPWAERELRPRAARAPHPGRRRRLHAAGRARAGPGADRLDDRRPRVAGRPCTAAATPGAPSRSDHPARR